MYMWALPTYFVCVCVCVFVITPPPFFSTSLKPSDEAERFCVDCSTSACNAVTML